MPKVSLDGITYLISDDQINIVGLIRELTYANTKIKESERLLTFLTRARIGYIEDLKEEIISEKSGFSL
jgi:hypothetical protein